MCTRAHKHTCSDTRANTDTHSTWMHTDSVHTHTHSHRDAHRPCAHTHTHSHRDAHRHTCTHRHFQRCPDPVHTGAHSHIDPHRPCVHTHTHSDTRIDPMHTCTRAHDTQVHTPRTGSVWAQADLLAAGTERDAWCLRRHVPRACLCVPPRPAFRGFVEGGTGLG